MKIAPLLVASASALETSTSANALLSAVGKRNVTHMESLIQGMVEESISEPGWKFDKDIQDALHAIRTMFVTSIQTALIDQHKVDQETHNCQTQECFDNCQKGYIKGTEDCEEHNHVCHEFQVTHEKCRHTVYSLYKTMAKSCAKLHCWDVPKIMCQTEECICPDVWNCHTGKTVTNGDDYEGWTGETLWCEATRGECKSKGYGAWLQGVIKTYEGAWEEWFELWKQCSYDYKEFLKADVKCDGVQKEFEKCMCEKSFWAEGLCSNDFVHCNQACWDIYEKDVPGLQCQEKDRKIDWSATKKIECYLDVLLFDYTKEYLLSTCGSETCVNVAREAKYKECATICQQVDFNGEWSEPTCSHEAKVWFDETYGHEPRHHKSEYLLGDSHFKCDMNGPHVHTDHRCTESAMEKGSCKTGRIEEERCTEHLDIDFQIPPYRECTYVPEPPCSDHFHCLYYEQFDWEEKIGCISDCCPDDHRNDGHCFPKQKLTSCSHKECNDNPKGTPTGHNCEKDEQDYDECSKAGTCKYDGLLFADSKNLNKIHFGEHTHVWAFNRCECETCHAKTPSYPPGPDREICTGVHTWHVAGDYA